MGTTSGCTHGRHFQRTVSCDHTTNTCTTLFAAFTDLPGLIYGKGPRNLIRCRVQCLPTGSVRLRQVRGSLETHSNASSEKSTCAGDPGLSHLNKPASLICVTLFKTLLKSVNPLFQNIHSTAFSVALFSLFKAILDTLGYSWATWVRNRAILDALVLGSS